MSDNSEQWEEGAIMIRTELYYGIHLLHMTQNSFRLVPHLITNSYNQITG